MLRRYSSLKPSRGTTIPAAVRRAVHERDKGCVGPRIGMEGPCFGATELDHVRNAGMARKSESIPSELASLCSTHHRVKTENGRTWRPRLIEYLESQ